VEKEPLIFWCGSVLNFDGLKKYKGETPAATQWSRSLLSGLLSSGAEVKVFSPVWDSYYPKGRLFPGDYSSLDSNFNQHLVKYVNFPYLRTGSVAASLSRQLDKVIRSEGRPVAILNYNTYPHYCEAIKSVIAKYPDIRWINIVLDLDDPSEDKWGKFLNDTDGSFGSVFLSWWGYNNAPVRNKLHLDGGWDGELVDYDEPEEKVFLYAGKMAKYGGILEVIDAINSFSAQNVRFEFYGKGTCKELEELAKKDPRVRINGFVSDDELDIACKKAFAFLSPRDREFQGTKMIFPSKILFYLKYLRPVITPSLPGLSPDYDDALVSLVNNSTEEWVSAMEGLLAESPEEKVKRQTAIATLMGRKKWEDQAQALKEFILSGD